MNIEPLESRIAPAKLLSLIDVDGDLITITTTTGTDAELLAVVGTSTPAGAVPGGVAIGTINLAANPAVFDGTSISVTAKRGPLGGDGLVNVARIDASALDLGKVTVKGDLSDLDAGKGTPASKVAAINVQSATGNPIWNLDCSVGSLTVKTNITTTEINISGARLGKLTVGGSLIGSDTTVKSGYIHVNNGTVGKVTIGGSIIGAAQEDSGKLTANSITSVTVGGSLVGGSANFSGQISAFGAGSSIGSVTVRGHVQGGGGFESGLIKSSGSLGSVTIGGSLIGGNGSNNAGSISGSQSIGKVTIGRDVIGGAAFGTGNIICTSGGIAAVTIGGSLLGGTGEASGKIDAEGDLGPILIRGDLQAGPADSGGTLASFAGRIVAAVSGSNFGNITSITIGGSVIGRGPAAEAQILADGAIGPVKIGGDLRGGADAGSGQLEAGKTLGLVTIGGSVLGGGGTDSGSIYAVGRIAGIKIGGSLAGGGGTASGTLSSDTAIGAIAIGGDFIGSGAFKASGITSTGPIASIAIGGSVMAGTGYAKILALDTTGPVATNLALKSLTVAGSVTQLFVATTSADAVIGSVKVGGDWRESTIAVSVTIGADGYATNNNTANGGGDPLLFSKIASITIGGAVIGTPDSVNSTDHYGFVAQKIGALKIGGTKIPLLPKNGDDSDATLSRYILSASRDVTVHEVA